VGLWGTIGFAAVEFTVPPQSKRFSPDLGLLQVARVGLVRHLGDLPYSILVRESIELADVDPFRRLVTLWAAEGLLCPRRSISVRRLGRDPV
jgi:hypothetical protein